MPVLPDRPLGEAAGVDVKFAPGAFAEGVGAPEYGAAGGFASDLDADAGCCDFDACSTRDGSVPDRAWAGAAPGSSSPSGMSSSSPSVNSLPYTSGCSRKQSCMFLNLSMQFMPFGSSWEYTKQLKASRNSGPQGPCAIPPRQGQSKLISPVSGLKAPSLSASSSSSSVPDGAAEVEDGGVGWAFVDDADEDGEDGGYAEEREAAAAAWLASGEAVEREGASRLGVAGIVASLCFRAAVNDSIVASSSVAGSSAVSRILLSATACNYLSAKEVLVAEHSIIGVFVFKAADALSERLGTYGQCQTKNRECYNTIFQRRRAPIVLRSSSMSANDAPVAL